MKFHKEKMDHMHLLESKLRPEMTIKPSALWQKRKVYCVKLHTNDGIEARICFARATRRPALRIEGNS